MCTDDQAGDAACAGDCGPGERQCDINGTPELCNAAGEWVNQGACGSAVPVCRAGACVLCEAGEKRCADNNSEQCQSDGSGWAALESCSGDTPVCLADDGVCGSCQAGDTQCMGDNVQSCVDGIWNTLAVCQSDTPDCVGGQCKPCDPAAGDRRCLDEDTLQICQSDGTWGGNQNCMGDTPECRADLNFACGCEEGARRCQSGGTPELCEGGVWREQSSCAGHCLPATGECVECEPAAEGCLDNTTPQLCSAAGSWQTPTGCNGTTPACQGGECAECINGDTRGCGNCELGTQSCSGGTWGSCQNDPIGPSCNNTPSCGSDGESCCKAEWVEGGTYTRLNSTGTSDSGDATVSGFCLDKYEITVGRMREFVADYNNFTPSAGAGEHQPGAGTGWLSEWDKGDELPASHADLEAALECSATYQTWRSSAGAATAERLPMNCLSWYTATAFCIWDGGRLPTEAEWQYAAGGSEGWKYPWGNTEPDAAGQVHAVFDDCGNDQSCDTTSYSDILPVGSRPGGNGHWGQSDLAGSMWEWTYDRYASSYPSSCNNCANDSAATNRVLRGGSWNDTAAYLTAASRNYSTPTYRYYSIGARCVRTTE